MRELQVCAKDKWTPKGPVRRMQFDCTGAKLVAWVVTMETTWHGNPGATHAIWACTVATGATQLLAEEFPPWKDLDTSAAAPAVSPDARLVATEYGYSSEYPAEASIYFTDVTRPDAELPQLIASAYDSGGLVFTPDGSELIAVRHPWTNSDDWVLDVARCPVGVLTQPPRSRRAQSLNWKEVMTLPRGQRATAVGLSADGNLLAVGTEFGTVHVANLKRKKVVASFPWEGRMGRAVRDRVAIRVGFDPGAKWVVMLVGGRLFARPLGAGKAWQTKTTLGYAHDFAFHPSGRVLCAAFEDGQARYLDPLTGAVEESFRWSKKPLCSVAFAPDGLTCAAGCESGKVVIWDVDA